MDTLVFTFEGLSISGNYISSFNNISAMDEAPTVNYFNRIGENCYFSAQVSGSILPNGSETPTEECGRFTLDIGGIEWSVTAEHAVSSGDEVTFEAYPLTPKTYIDAYGKLHIGDEVQNGDRLTITAKLINRNPSGNGYELTSGNSIILGANFINSDMLGNFNSAEHLPYIAYQPFDTPTPASGNA